MGKNQRGIIMSIQIHFSRAPLGHEIRGVNVNELFDHDFALIEQAYDQYGVIVIRGQCLSPEQQVAFSQRFGALDRYILDKYNLATQPEIFVVSNVIENGKSVGLADAGRYWHSDMWSIPNPPRGSMLHALEVPHADDGTPLGDTCFASMAAAYDGLPVELRSRIEGRRAFYSTQKLVEFRQRTAGALSMEAQEGYAERMAHMTPEIEHELVRRHPRTGRKCIYYSEGAISHIVGMTQEESAPVLEAVRKHVLKPEYVYRHRWRVGDIVMWDNISCIHKAIADFDLPLRRRMHRTTLASLAVS